MKVGTWVQFENESKPLGYITHKEQFQFIIKLLEDSVRKYRCTELKIYLDGYATEYERKLKINRIIEFQA